MASRWSLSFCSSLALLTAAVAGQQAAVTEPAPPGIEQIDRDALLAHATFLAADELGGRLTGSPGQQAAAAYIAEQLAQLGLEPLGDVGEHGARGFLQRYPIERTALVDAQLEFAGAAFADGFAVLPSRRGGGVSARGWVLAGARGEMPDLQGAVAVVRLPTPRLPRQQIDAVFASAFRGFARARGIARRAAKAGARAVVFLIEDDGSGVSTSLNYFGLAPGKDLLSHRGDGGMADMANAWRTDVPQVFLSVARSAQLLQALGGESAPVGARAAGGLSFDLAVDRDAQASNVVAVLRGSDSDLAAEAVVYSAHMDHVGQRLDGDVFNGADDNASGSAGLLEIAQAYVRAGAPPRRSVVFLSVSGEELGLWGSAWFASHSPWPLADIVAAVNTDMIGRSGPESGPAQITVTPSYRHPKFSTLVRDAARLGLQLGLDFEVGDKYYTRSDHFNFAKRGVPVVFFCNGEHEDYHQVSDHADKLDPEKMERVARLAYWVGRRAADADERPRTLGRARGWSGEMR